jgi:hypothetical protein
VYDILSSELHTLSAGFVRHANRLHATRVNETVVQYFPVAEEKRLAAINFRTRRQIAAGSCCKLPFEKFSALSVRVYAHSRLRDAYLAGGLATVSLAVTSSGM